MPKYRVEVVRTEYYYDYVDVKADSEREAKEKITTILHEYGWDGVFDGADGEYEDCVSTVNDVREVGDD